jgi:protein-tyrosine phosphatase
MLVEASRCRFGGAARRPASPDRREASASTPFGAIDLHSHVLPEIDDGPESLVESLQLARALAASGVEVLAATPHVSERYPTRWDDVERGLSRLRFAIDAAGIEITVVQGAEIALDQLDRLDTQTLHELTFGGGGAFVLLEFPYEGWPSDLPERIDRLAGEGISAVLAHPERNPVVQSAPQRLAGLVDAGALVQVNAGSLVGGRTVGATAKSLLDSGLAHLLASDSHRVGMRPTIAAAAATLPAPLAQWLARDVPAAVLAGSRPPARPPERRRRTFW